MPEQKDDCSGYEIFFGMLRVYGVTTPHTSARHGLEGELATDEDDARHAGGLALVELAEVPGSHGCNSAMDIVHGVRAQHCVVHTVVDGVVECVDEGAVDCELVALAQLESLAEAHVEHGLAWGARIGERARRVAELRIVERTRDGKRGGIEVRSKVRAEYVVLPVLVEQRNAGNDVGPQGVSRRHCVGGAVVGLIGASAGRCASIRPHRSEGDEVAVAA